MLILLRAGQNKESIREFPCVLRMPEQSYLDYNVSRKYERYENHTFNIF